MIEHYKYKKRSKPKINLAMTKPKFATIAEQLMGQVKGMKASQIEERFAQALDKKGVFYYFRLPIGNRGEPGWKELDFLVVHGGAYYPVEIEDITFVHRGTASADIQKDLVTIEYLKEYNPFPVQHVTNERLGTAEDADLVVKEMFL